MSTRAQLKTLRTNTFKSGLSNTLASEVRTYEGDLIDSCVNKDDDANQVNGYFALNGSGDAVLPGNVICENSYSTSNPPVASLGPGAGTGASINITGSNECGIIDLTTGTSPSSGSIVVKLKLSDLFSFPTMAICVLQPANDEASGLNLLVVTEDADSVTISTNAFTTLGVTTNYIFNYIIKGY